MCDYNADCVALSNTFDPDKECRCRTGFTGQGEICAGGSTVLFDKCSALVCGRLCSFIGQSIIYKKIIN